MWGASALVAVSSASLGRLSSDQGGSSVLILPPLLSVVLYLIHLKSRGVDPLTLHLCSSRAALQDVSLKGCEVALF